jgi:hypothetical protein
MVKAQSLPHACVMSQHGLLPLTQMSNYDMYHAIFVLKSWKTSLCRHMCVMSRDQLPKEISYSIVMRLNFSLYDIQFGLLDPPLGVDEYLSLNYYLVKGHVQFFFFFCVF